MQEIINRSRQFKAKAVNKVFFVKENSK